jgi:hypothetical protein
MAKFGYKRDMQVEKFTFFYISGYLLEFGSWIWNRKLFFKKLNNFFPFLFFKIWLLKNNCMFFHKEFCIFHFSIFPLFNFAKKKLLKVFNLYRVFFLMMLFFMH